jgi:hypothetical protein
LFRVVAVLSQGNPDWLYKIIEKEANGLLLTADIAPAVAFDKLEEVMVITGVYAPVADAPGQEE